MPQKTNAKMLKQAANRLYADQFLEKVGKRFGFDALEPETALKFHKIAWRYLIAKRDASRRGTKTEYEKKWRALSRATLKFIEILKEAQDDGIATDMFMRARRNNRSNDQFGISDLPESQIQGENDRHYQHLLALMNLLTATVQGKLRQFKLPSGPRKNEGLESLVQDADYFWSDKLGRKFTLDYHQGAALTEAFEFVSALVAPLDSVTETQIITAMRAEIKSRNARDKKLRERKQHRLLPKPAYDAHKI